MALSGIPFSEIKKIDYIICDTKKSGKEIFEEYKPDYLINATLFDVTTGTVITYSKDGDNLEGYLFSKNGIGIKNNLPIWTNYDVIKNDNSIVDFMGGSPTLVVNGQKVIDAGTTESWILNSSSYRSYIGFNDTHLYLGCTEQTQTIDSLATTCLNNGFKYAINLDGGGSCTLIQKDANGKAKILIDRESRKCPSWILVYLKEQTTTTESVTTTEIVYNNTEFLNGVIINGSSYLKIRELEKLGFTINFSNGTVYINKK